MLKLASEIVGVLDGVTDVSLFELLLAEMAAKPAFVHLAETAALKMVTGLYAGQAHTWQQAARRSTKGR